MSDTLLAEERKNNNNNNNNKKRSNTICLPNLFDRGVLRIVVAAYFIDHYCLMFDREVVHIVVVVILLIITICCLTEK